MPTVYAGGQATNVPDKNAFYQLVAANKGLGAQQFANNPFGVSYQELYGMIGEPSAPTSSGGGGGGGSAVAAAPAAPAFDQVGSDQLNAAINNLGTSQNAGYANIDNNYSTALQQLLEGKNAAQATNDQNVKQNQTNYVGAKNTIGANAGSTLNGLLRLLGSRGAGGSSAALYSAPGAVGRQATLQRTDAGNTFANNQQGLDQNWGTYLQGYNDNVSNEGVQRQNDRSALENSIANSRGSLLTQLANLTGQSADARNSYLAQANGLASQVAGYVPAPVHITTNAYQAPSLASYTTTPGAAPTYQGQPASNDYTSPFLAGLLGKKQPGTLGTAAG